MRTRIGSAALGALALVVSSCTDTGPVSPITPGAPRLAEGSASASYLIRISEIHYDNTGTDAGERIEVSAPAGTNLSGYSVVLYNGSGGASYGTTPLTGVVADQCRGRGTAFVSYSANGIQNGAPDGVALVAPDGSVLEFLSYEGVFTATNGPALGLQSVDIGASETGSEPLGLSLQRDSLDVWTSPAVAATFGACNAGEGTPRPPAVATTVAIAPETATVAQNRTVGFSATAFDAEAQPIAGARITWSSLAPATATIDAATGVATGISQGIAQIVATAASGAADTASLTVRPPIVVPVTRISEIHYDNSGTDAGEAIEIEGPANQNLAGWALVLYNGNGGVPYGTPQPLTGIIPATCGARGVLSFPVAGLQNGGSSTPEPDGVALVNAAGEVVEFLSYEGTIVATSGPAAGRTSLDIGVKEDPAPPAGESLQRTPDGLEWYGPSESAFGACSTPKPVPPPLTFSGRLPGEPPLPVGFEDQLFATLRRNGAVVATTITWSSETPDVATIDDRGVMRALTAGTAVLRATASDGTTATLSLPTRIGVASTTARYDGNTEFGIPTDADAADDLILTRPRYTTSFSTSRNTPNWVSYNLEATHFGAEDRCDCFTYDPELPEAGRYTTADYTGVAAINGYSIDRGHLVRSFDRTTGSLDNAETFYFSNIVPQASDNNQGPWAAFESYLGDLARLQNREVYIVAGVAGSNGTVKNENKITIPASVWKVAVILPRDQGLASIDDYTDVEVVAVVMPNVAGIRNVPWETYRKTVDQVEAISGYDVLALLPDGIEALVESGAKPPVASAGGPYASTEGAAVALTAAASTDPNGDALAYAWDFGDGTTGAGASPSHSYAQDGAYTARVIATDPAGLADTATAAVTVANVAPSVAPLAGAIGSAALLPGETYTEAGSFADPGADPWSATVDYGDGGVSALALSGKTFALSHTYAAAGSFPVTVVVDDDDASGKGTATVTVITIAAALDNALGLVDGLLKTRKLNGGNATAFRAKLQAAKASVQRGDAAAALAELRSLVAELDSLVADRRLTSAEAGPLRAYVNRIIA